MEQSSSVLQGHPIVSGRPSRSYAADRVCAEDECITRLSIYNPGKFCGAHGDDPRRKVQTMKNHHIGRGYKRAV